MYITSIANGVCQFSGAKGRGGRDFFKGCSKKSLLGGGHCLKGRILLMGHFV